MKRAVRSVFLGLAKLRKSMAARRIAKVRPSQAVTKVLIQERIGSSKKPGAWTGECEGIGNLRRWRVESRMNLLLKVKCREREACR